MTFVKSIYSDSSITIVKDYDFDIAFTAFGVFPPYEPECASDSCFDSEFKSHPALIAIHIDGMLSLIGLASIQSKIRFQQFLVICDKLLKTGATRFLFSVKYEYYIYG